MNLDIFIFTIIVSFGIYKRINFIYSLENDNHPKAQKYPKYLSFISGNIFPLFLLASIGTNLFFNGVSYTIHETISMLFNTFLHVTIYYSILVAFMLKVRKTYDSHICSIFWMLPNFIWYANFAIIKQSKPLLIINVSEKLTYSIFILWLFGFISILLWKIVSHLHFRKSILKNAIPINDEVILKLWNEELDLARVKNKTYKLMTSPDISSPLSIGLFQKKIVVLLPDKNYSFEDLQLIFRHEIIHISREDGWTKFSLVFFTALCWFNPLTWFAMKKNAEEIELSCDESILQNLDDTQKHQYATLILNTSGNEKGFTTCLSSSFSSMRYRLSQIISPIQRSTNAFIIGFIFFILIMSYGYISISYGKLSGSDVVFNLQNANDYQLNIVCKHNKNDHNQENIVTSVNKQLLNEYLQNLTLKRITGNYSFSNKAVQENLEIIYSTPNGSKAISLYDDILYIYTHENGWNQSYYYLLYEETDWDYLNNLILY